MKTVLISIKPKWCEKIASGKKTIEVRKSAPKEVPFKAYIYATRPKNFYKCGAVSTSDELLWLANGKVEMGDGFKFWADGDEYQCLNGRIIGEFICDKVYLIKNQGNRFVVANEAQGVTNEIARQSCLDYYDMDNYLDNKDGYGLHITDLKIYDKPKKLSEFCLPCKKNCEDCEKQIFYDCWKEKGKIKVVTRPPQSWQYVEELGNEQRTNFNCEKCYTEIWRDCNYEKPHN